MVPTFIEPTGTFRSEAADLLATWDSWAGSIVGGSSQGLGLSVQVIGEGAVARPPGFS